jgi:regulator of sigma E protease
MLHWLIGTLRTPVAFLVVIGVLVFVHECGHYLVARLVGCRVEAFAIGFGKPIAAWTDRAGTVWQIGWIPIGGFVRIHGFERPDLMAPEARAALIPGRGFHDRSVPARAAVAFAGPAANFLLTFVLLAGLFMAVGRPIPSAVVGQVVAGQPAAAAGLLPGDRVTAVDGRPIDSFIDLQAAILPRAGQHVTLTLSRGATTLQRDLLVGSATGPSGRVQGRIGIASGPVEYRPAGPIGALSAAATGTWSTVTETAKGLWMFVTGQASARDLGGTLRIAQMSGQVARLGAASFITFIAILSVNLGLINLVPIPVLDGGHLLFLAMEAIRGRPVPARFYEYGMRLGMGIIATLLVFSAINDLTHFGLFHWLAGRAG